MHLPTILIAEDERILQDLYAEICSDEGLVAIQAYDGLSTWDRLSHCHDIDLLILDLMLPGMSGDAILERLRKDPSHIPVVIVSAIAQETNSLEDIGPGKVIRLEKGSIGIRTIMQKIADYLRTSQGL